MATVPTENDPGPAFRAQLEAVRPFSNTRWGAVLAGVFVSAALWLVLHMFGMGLGLTSLDPDGTSSLRSMGIGIGVWSLIAPILALFVGGLVVSRLAPSPNRLNRMLHGGLVWAVTSLAGVVVIASVIARLAGGAASVAGETAAAAASTAGKLAGQVDLDSLKALGIDRDDLVAPINQRLRADGKPEVNAAQLEAAAKDTLSSAVETGSLDKTAVVQALARHTALGRADAEDIATQIETRWNALTRRAAETAHRAKVAALQAADMTGKALTGLAIAMVLSLIAAMLGAALTGYHDRRRKTVVSDDAFARPQVY